MSGAMTEFRITSDLSALRQQAIDANFDEVREWLIENLAPYRDMAVTPDSIPAAKSYRANIRKVKDRIEQSRKEAKAAALSAYSDFEGRCKGLTGLCDEAANAIDAQVKAIENAEADAKIAEIRAAYDKIAAGELLAFCPWDYVYNDKWRNKGIAAEYAIVEMESVVRSTENDLSAIRSMGGDDTPYLLDVYMQTHDLSSVIRKASDLATLRKQEATAKGETDNYLASFGAAENEERVTVDFRVICTKTQLAALGDYMKRNGIEYGRVT